LARAGGLFCHGPHHLFYNKINKLWLIFSENPVPQTASLRVKQIRIAASLLSHLGRRPSGARILCRAGHWPLVGPALRFLVGYRRSFASLEAAAAAARRHLPMGHDHPAQTELYIAMADVIRESDYPALFHLAPVAPGLRQVFDLGGAVGNLLYSYARHLPFSEALVWTVCDLPARRAAGIELARQRGEARIRFTEGFEEAAGADLLLVSGALHYFDEPLHPMLGRLDRLPRRVLVNRSPFSRGSPLVSVQDAGELLVACKSHDRTDFIAGMQALGYRLIAAWPVFELQAWVPLSPELCYPHYWGFYFELPAGSCS
jgi:putative methyltransferase (TIGR04325 family)